MIPGARGPVPKYDGRDCASCRWFGQASQAEVDRVVFKLGICGRPEGPLDPRLALGTEARVSAKTGLVSSGMGCRAHEARDGAVTPVTEKGEGEPDLWGT